MSEAKNLEVWLRGPVPQVPALLQPVAHALLQAREEVHTLLHDFPEELLWQHPAGVASVGFHLQHLKGVLDRLLTYARGEVLSEEQLNYLYAEGKPAKQAQHHLPDLLQAFDRQVDRALEQLRQTDEKSLLAPRAVGRAKIASTVQGLLFHAAEHAMRHVGQLLVTVHVLWKNSVQTANSG